MVCHAGKAVATFLFGEPSRFVGEIIFKLKNIGHPHRIWKEFNVLVIFYGEWLSNALLFVILPLYGQKDYLLPYTLKLNICFSENHRS